MNVKQQMCVRGNQRLEGFAMRVHTHALGREVGAAGRFCCAGAGLGGLCIVLA